MSTRADSSTAIQLPSDHAGHNETVPASIPASPFDPPALENSITTAEARRQRLWGRNFSPPIRHEVERKQFRRICLEMEEHIDLLYDYSSEDGVSEEAIGCIAELHNFLERLFDLNFGNEDSLAEVVVAIQTQVANVQWTQKHVVFLKVVIAYLKMRTVINDKTVSEVIEIIREHSLDPYRGVLSCDDAQIRYTITEISEEL